MNSLPKLHPLFDVHKGLLTEVNESKNSILDALSQFFALVYQNKYAVCDDFYLTPTHLSCTVRIEDYWCSGEILNLMIPLELMDRFHTDTAENVRKFIKENGKTELEIRRASLRRELEKCNQEIASYDQS